MRLPVVLRPPVLPISPLVVRGLRRREPDMRKPVAIFAVLMVCVVCRTSPAEDPAVAAAYGAGVHGYYAGNFQQSHDTLSRVVSIGTDDPRVYYFRGLAALRLGRRDEAIADFSEGADLEAAGWSIRTVSRSLERVQGPDRLLLERSRTRARLAIAQAQRPAGGTMRSAGADLSGPRYSGIGGSRGTAPVADSPTSPMPAVQQKPMPTIPPAMPEAGADEPMTMRQSPTRPTPTSPKPTPTADPFGDDPFADDPFSLDMGTSRRGSSDTQRDQIDAQNELRSAEATDVLDQREAMAERDAAAGDR